MIRMLEYPPTSAVQLFEIINGKFKKTFKVTYQDEDGDMVDVLDDEDLRIALKHADMKGKIEFTLEDIDTIGEKKSSNVNGLQIGQYYQF